MRTVVVDGGPLRLDDVVAVARGEAGAELDPGVAGRMELTRNVVRDAVDRGLVMYGVTTGFGALADTRIPRADLERMQVSLLRSHAAASGAPLGDAVVRALLLLRARTLAAGISGVRVDLPARLLDLLNHGLLPVDPGQGLGRSLGRPRPTGPPRAAADRRGPAAARRRRRPAGPPGRRAARRGGPGAAGAGPQGGAVASSTAPSRCRRCCAWPSTRPSCSPRRPTSPAR